MTNAETRQVDIMLLHDREVRLAATLQAIERTVHGLEQARQNREYDLARVRATLALVEGSDALDDED